MRLRIAHLSQNPCTERRQHSSGVQAGGSRGCQQEVGRGSRLGLDQLPEWKSPHHPAVSPASCHSEAQWGQPEEDRWVPDLEIWWAVGTSLMTPLTGGSWAHALSRPWGLSGQRRGVGNMTVKPEFGDSSPPSSRRGRGEKGSGSCASREAGCDRGREEGHRRPPGQ